jgi:hypothetical protein
MASRKNNSPDSGGAGSGETGSGGVPPEIQLRPELDDASERTIRLVEEIQLLPPDDEPIGAPEAEIQITEESGAAVTEPEAASEDGAAVSEAETPEGAAPPPEVSASGVIWDLFALGDPMSGVLARLEDRGVEVRKIGEQTRLGSWFYVPQFADDSVLPVAPRESADSVSCVIEEYRDKLLEVGISFVWSERKNNFSFKDGIFEELNARLTEEYGARTKFTDTGLFTESAWIAGDTQVRLSGAAGLDGRVLVKVTYQDIPGSKVFFAAGGAQGTGGDGASEE